MTSMRETVEAAVAAIEYALQLGSGDDGPSGQRHLKKCLVRIRCTRLAESVAGQPGCGSTWW
ncbi:hypothetical protein WH50_15240 [Pokkaliibacter plantistimulans]|uniref:Uncharacterized protein n=1 Tax=Pokkaliibacter plantistimulans TaxID=1635171 RepID=A0ABX5LY93_9GAMM|nr:hypothetical protein WH50_15240 [Pokkaliibacter plantistimulans]